jgi:hypothetical protein
MSEQHLRLDPQNFTLTTTELIAALRLVGYRTMLGFPADVYDRMTDEAFVDTLADGLYRLFHLRGLYEPFLADEHPDALAAHCMFCTLRICVEPCASLIVNVRHAQDQAAEAWWVWQRHTRVEDVFVKYSRRSENRHTFQTLIGRAALYDDLRRYLRVTNATRTGESVAVEEPTLAALHESPGDESILAGCPVLRDTLVRTGYHLWGSALRYDGRPAVTFNVLCGPDVVWLLHDTADGVQFTPAASDHVHHQLDNLVTAFLN